MRKRILSMVLLLCGVLGAHATANYMTVELKTGDKFSFLLAENPVVTYVDGNLVVNGNETTSYSINGVKNYHFTESDETDVQNVSSEMLRVVTFDENTIRLENATAGVAVSLVNAAGVTFSTKKVDQNGIVNLELPTAKGVYVLVVGKQSIKIVRK